MELVFLILLHDMPVVENYKAIKHYQWGFWLTGVGGSLFLNELNAICYGFTVVRIMGAATTVLAFAVAGATVVGGGLWKCR